MAGGITLGELGRKLTALEQEVGELRELVDGQESWSHRKRLHLLEDDQHAAELVAEALDDFREGLRVAAQLRRARWGGLRDWLSVAVAAAAVAVALVALLHGYPAHVPVAHHGR